MHVEEKLINFISNVGYDDIPEDQLDIVKTLVLTIFGTTIAGAYEQGCGDLLDYQRKLGGIEEATVLVHGGRFPAQDAAFLNGYMARAVDYCDAMKPGMHIGSSMIPAALAAAELNKGCNGKDFLSALCLGAETSIRLNLPDVAYDGFDPTGVCAIFAATASVCRILGLNEDQTMNAMALAFNRSSGSLQPVIDGSLAMRSIQGWTAQNAVVCCRHALLGITGPLNFLTGTYGYYHLFGKDLIKPESILTGLGKSFGLEQFIFKKYPSCGLTQACTEIILKLIEETDITPENTEKISAKVHPYAFSIAGHPFQTGENPRANGMFSIRYCIANALIRKDSRLILFEEEYVKDPGIKDLTDKIDVISDPGLIDTGHTAIEIKILTAGGSEYTEKMDVAPGFLENPLTQADHENRFFDCIDFPKKAFSRENGEKVVDMVEKMESLGGVRVRIPLLAATV